MVKLREVNHLGAVRLYFANAEVQAAYEEATGRKTVTPEITAFLERVGVKVER